jgi:hypothetical protein
LILLSLSIALAAAPSIASGAYVTGVCTATQAKMKTTIQAQSGQESTATRSARQETWAAHGRRWKFLLLLLPGFYTASMDLTIVATAQPFIASHFRMYSIEHYHSAY